MFSYVFQCDHTYPYDYHCYTINELYHTSPACVIEFHFYCFFFSSLVTIFLFPSYFSVLSFLSEPHLELFDMYGYVPFNIIFVVDWVYVDGKKDGLPSYGPSLGLKEQEKDGGLAKIDGPLGRKLKDKSKEAGESEAGPSSSNWAADLGCQFLAEMDVLVRDGPLATQEKAGLLGRFNSRKITTPEDPLKCWVPEEIRREQGEIGFSLTDRALEEEAKRYVLHSHGVRVMGTFLSSSSISDRAPMGGSFDCLGETEEEL